MDFQLARNIMASQPKEVRPAKTPCPYCGRIAMVVWSPGPTFRQHTECRCGRKTWPVDFWRDARADTTDAVREGKS